MDVFCEYMVKHKKSLTDNLTTVAWVVLAVIVSALSILFMRYTFGFWIFIIVGAWYGAVILIRRTDIEYEYILTNGNLDIDKIMGKKTRKRVLSIDFSSIDICAPCEKQTLSENVTGKKVYDLTGDINAEGVYYVDFSKNAVNHRVYFQPNTKMIKNIKMKNPLNVKLREEDIR